MDALKLWEKKYGPYNSHVDSLRAIKFAEEYHQHRQAEEAQERYEKAIAYWRRPMTGLSGSDVDPAVQVPRTLRIAAGIEGKEEK